MTRPSFSPSWWASGPHAQTLVARVLRSPRGPDFHRERLNTPDGDFIDIDWGPEPRPGAPIVLVLHGLEGSSRRRYVRSVSRRLLGLGMRPLAMNFRGCSGEPNRALRSYHSGDTEDVSWLLGLVRDRYPQARLGAVGFSLGGNVLLKLLGERADGGQGLVDAAAVISVPYDLAAGSAELERTHMGRVYTQYFLRSLRRKITAKRAELAERIDIEAADTARTIREFDDRVTAPLNGFADALDYYGRCSSKFFLPRVGVPTLMLHSEDDPFLPREAVPVAEVGDNPCLTLDLVPGGGHVGFLEGTPWAARFWADEAAAHFVAEILDRGR